ncbi:hypothetical protein EV421DRAFT_1910176 [Armillaria borealis]|uniref:Uncharacterized protein n=1 Tax=Armillaria borealis TaxID=47425 RepID=A0AA39IZF3_9AGAR|nr:hypothetical protein EV421DRAFT_1910176 [Armillaria borealis]
MSAPETATKFAPTQSSSVLGGQIVGRSERQAVAPPAALKLRLDLNLEVEIAIQAKCREAYDLLFQPVNGCLMRDNGTRAEYHRELGAE